jgi:hypothetical protein
MAKAAGVTSSMVSTVVPIATMKLLRVGPVQVTSEKNAW